MASILALVVSLPASGQALDLFRPPPETWTHPRGEFALTLPEGWTASLSGEILHLWRRGSGGRALAHGTLERRTIPEGGLSLGHFALQAEEDAKRAAPRFRAHGRQKTQVAGEPGRVLHFEYKEKAHTQLRNEVLQTVWLTPGAGWIFQVETSAGMLRRLSAELDTILESLRIRRPQDKPIRPERRRKGRLLNPDHIRYAP